MGVAALLLVILVQITALAAIPAGGRSAGAVVRAAVTGRVGVVLATGHGSAGARPGGFGALITETTTGWVRAAAIAALLAAVVAGAFLLGAVPRGALSLGSATGIGQASGPHIAVRAGVAALAGLGAGDTRLRR